MTVKHPGFRPARYGTSEVTLILGIEAWRIKNFTSPAYGLQPTVTARGRGTRRYFSFEDVLRHAVANELYDAGFGPDAVGGAIRAIDGENAIQKWSGSYDERGKAKPLLLILGDRKKRRIGKWERDWKVVSSTDAKSTNADILVRGSVAVSLDLVAIWEWTVGRITELEGAGKL